MLRAVIDTNIYISAVNFGGAPEVILRAAEQDVGYQHKTWTSVLVLCY